MTNKFLIQIAVVAFSALALALVVVARIGTPLPRTEGVRLPQVTPVTTVIRGPQSPSLVPAEPVAELETPAFTQPLANPVTTSDLSKLEHQVRLKNSDLANVNRSEWEKALPKARQLLQGACDCEERNWLNHFVETGSEALTGAKEFPDSAKLLASLPKNDEEATKHVVSD